MGAWKLKIFFSISLSIHLLILFITYLLFPDFKIGRLPTFNMEVSLLPLMAEEKQVKPQIKKEERRLLPPVQSVTPDILIKETIQEPIKEPSPPLQYDKVEETINEPIPKPQAVALPSDEGLPSKKEENSIPLQVASSRIEELNINIPASSPFGEWHRDPLPKPESTERPQMAMKNPSLSDGEILFAKPRYAENPKPLYPQEARKRGYQGEVVLRVEVLSNGRVGQVEVKKSSGYKLLDQSALTTVKQWRFIPAKKGDNTIPLWVNIPIKFQLQ